MLYFLKGNVRGFQKSIREESIRERDQYNINYIEYSSVVLQAVLDI